MRTSVRGGIEDFLCPFTDMYITQGSNGSYSHQGIMANDVRGLVPGERYPYYAPCTCKCLKVYTESGQSMWQSTNKVRFANGRIDYATFMIAHDDDLDKHTWVGKVISQGDLLGVMGTKGYATGVHCHIQTEQGSDTSWYKNKYGIYQFNNEVDLDDMYFVDFTNILEGMGGNWKVTSDVPVEENNLYVCNYNMNVRCGAGTNYDIKKVQDLTPNGQENVVDNNPNSNAVYKKGTIFTCYEKITNSDGSIWGRSPSGYICITGVNGECYCEVYNN